MKTNLQEQLLQGLKEDALKNARGRNKYDYLNYQSSEGGLIPISNGNSFIVNELLRLYAEGDSLTYKLFLLEQEYWTELWDIEKGSCPELERIWKTVMVVAWTYGQVAVHRLPETKKFVALGIVSHTLDMNMDILDAVGFVNNVSFIGASTDDENSDIKLTNYDSILGKWNYQGIPAVWLYLPFCFNLKKHYISYIKNLIFNTKRIKYIVKNEDVEVIQKELNSMFSIENNIIFQINNSQNPSNEIEILENSNENKNILGDLHQYKKSWYYSFGRRYSFESDKKERNINAEFEHDELQYTLIENSIERFLKDIVERFNIKWGFNAVLEKVSDVVKIQDIKEQEFVAHGDQNNNTE